MKQDEIEDEAALLSINNHIHRLQILIDEKKQKIQEDAQIRDNIKVFFNTVGEKYNKERTEIHSHFMDESLRLVKDLREMISQSKVETHDLKQQVFSYPTQFFQQLQAINQDKIRLQQNVIVLESRITETDKDIGFKRRARSLKV
ncbi:hypothetical protein pb186bvf_012674 [Paramecium bursaria]